MVLREHLDGGLRPASVLEMADAIGHALPADDAEGLARWFVEAASSPDGVQDALRHAHAVLQTAEHLRRAARESVLDLAADGVVHVEVRYAPEAHVAGGLEPAEVVTAVADGLAEGEAEVADAGGVVSARQILVASRTSGGSADVARLALAHRDRGVVGFDLAGPDDLPVARHAAALRTVRRAGMRATVHAGETAGVASVADAVHVAGAVRLGHGLGVLDDVRLGRRTDADPHGVRGAVLGDVAHWVRDQRVALEMCPTANVQSGLVRSVGTHPVTALARLGFTVTVNPDRRLLTGMTASRELAALVADAGWGPDDLERVAVAAARASFLHHDEREALVEDVIRAGHREQPPGRHRAAR